MNTDPFSLLIISSLLVILSTSYGILWPREQLFTQTQYRKTKLNQADQGLFSVKLINPLYLFYIKWNMYLDEAEQRSLSSSKQSVSGVTLRLGVVPAHIPCTQDSTIYLTMKATPTDPMALSTSCSGPRQSYSGPAETFSEDALLPQLTGSSASRDAMAQTSTWSWVLWCLCAAAHSGESIAHMHGTMAGAGQTGRGVAS